MRKVIMDVDTGSDDAVALMVASLHKKIKLVAVCTVAGNQPLDKTTENTLRVKELLHAKWPVYKGCDRGIVKEDCPWRLAGDYRIKATKDGKQIKIHEEYLNLPEAKGTYMDKPASIFYVDYLMKQKEKITICAVGPLTNLAIAIAIEPRIIEHIDEIVIMGGACDISNASSSAEFNIFRDPEAAQRVFKCGAKIVLVPLDATHKAVVAKADRDLFREINNPVSNFAADLCEQRAIVHTQQQPLWIEDACALHDALAVSYIVDPKVLTDLRYLPVDVSLSGLTEGATIVDQRTIVKNPNVYYAFDGDRKKFVKIMCDAFKRYDTI